MAHLARAKRLTAPVQAALAKNLLHDRKGYSLFDSTSPRLFRMFYYLSSNGVTIDFTKILQQFFTFAIVCHGVYYLGNFPQLQYDDQLAHLC